VGGAASLLSFGRAGALAALLAALVAYAAFAGHLFELPSGLDVAFHALVVVPAFTATIWLARPLARARTVALVVAAAVAALAALGLSFLDVDSASNVAKLACYALLGFWFLSLFEELWWIALVSVLVPWVDVWSVAFGPTRYVVEEQPGFFEQISVALPNLGQAPTLLIGPPDILFFALFLATADRFRLRVLWTWLGMTALLGATLVLVSAWEDIPGLPALPAVCLGFLLPNADLLWRNARKAWRSRQADSEARSSTDTDST
jgi:hypothetical protein